MVNRWQNFFLIVLTLPIMGHVVLLPLVINLAGRDSWISALIAFPVGAFFLFLLYRLRLHYPDKDILVSLKKMLGNVLGVLTVTTLVIYFLFLASLSLASLVDMISTVFLPQTPVWVLVVSFLLLSINGALKDVKGIALTASILFFIVMFTGHSLTFINFPERRLSDLLPVLEYGWKPVILGTVLLSTIWIELLFMLIIPIRNIREKRFYFVALLGVFANVVMILSTMSGAIMTFGLGQSQSFVYPALEIVRIININFVDRLDVYGLILMTFGSYIRCSLFMRISCDQILGFLGKRKKWKNAVVYMSIAIIIGVLGYYMGYTRMNQEYFLTVYAYSIVLYPLPLFLLFVVWMRKKKFT
ncbi:MAG TPA: endospore germination permease [Bacillota bacterium]